MKKTILFTVILLLTAAFGLRAQSIGNSDWKTFIGDPLNDTLTFHIRGDSSYVTTSQGDVVVRSHCTISGDTLSLRDYEGQYACPDMEGKYKFMINGQVLVLTLIDDPCEGRMHSIDGIKWAKASK